MMHTTTCWCVPSCSACRSSSLSAAADGIRQRQSAAAAGRRPLVQIFGSSKSPLQASLSAVLLQHVLKAHAAHSFAHGHGGDDVDALLRDASGPPAWCHRQAKCSTLPNKDKRHSF